MEVRMELLHAFFQKIPMAALFVSLAIGYWIGKFKIGNFQLGGMAGRSGNWGRTTANA
jgi:hypothetical protein